MNDCTFIRQAAMALADGEKAAMDASCVQSHLAACVECRRAVEEMRSLDHLFVARPRHLPATDLWPRVQRSLAVPAAKARPFSRPAMFVLLVVALLLLRAALFTTGQASEWVARFVALLFVLGWLVALRDNPFAVNPHLITTSKAKS